MTRKPMPVREPVQAYLDQPDATLLEELAERTASSKAEVIRQAIRRMARELDLATRPGASLAALTGSLDLVDELPADLAARHDDYLYDEGQQPAASKRRR
jgi:hypothetical protein